MSWYRYKNTGRVDIRTIEACSKLITAICKADRFGLYSHSPISAGDVEKNTNRQEILQKIGDVVDICNILKADIERDK